MWSPWLNRTCLQILAAPPWDHENSSMADVSWSITTILPKSREGLNWLLVAFHLIKKKATFSILVIDPARRATKTKIIYQLKQTDADSFSWSSSASISFKISCQEFVTCPKLNNLPTMVETNAEYVSWYGYESRMAGANGPTKLIILKCKLWTVHCWAQYMTWPILGP